MQDLDRIYQDNFIKVYRYILSLSGNAAVAEDKVIYEEVGSIANYWKADNKTAPVKAGYVFGGWFKTSTANAVGAEAYVNGGATSYYAPLKSTELNTDEDADCDYTGTAYAKFVPAQVLSVKAQNSAATVTNSTELRSNITCDCCFIASFFI